MQIPKGMAPGTRATCIFCKASSRVCSSEADEFQDVAKKETNFHAHFHLCLPHGPSLSLTPKHISKDYPSVSQCLTIQGLIIE